MTREQQLIELRSAKSKLRLMRESLLRIIYQRWSVEDANRLIKNIEKQHCKINQLRFKYWIFNGEENKAIPPSRNSVLR